MRVCGRSSVDSLLGDFVVYRSLKPADARLPRWPELAVLAGLPAGVAPRKSETSYGAAIAQLLRSARAIDAPESPIERLLYLGDTQMNDLSAFRAICQAGGWRGLAFIGSETVDPCRIDVDERSHCTTVCANRWSVLDALETYPWMHAFAIDERTAVVVDLDKTLIGARGRNDHVIDRARRAALQATVRGALGDPFDGAAFDRSYERLNRPDCHVFTGDNQDIVAYLCVILGSGLVSLDGLMDRITTQRPGGFRAFLEVVDARTGELPAAVSSLHQRVRDAVGSGDPTPFKTFRRREFAETAAQMGSCPDSSSADELLDREIVITREVYDAAQRWRDRGAILLGLSDKPDEACFPADANRVDAPQPIHRQETHVVGE